MLLSVDGMFQVAVETFVGVHLWMPGMFHLGLKCRGLPLGEAL
jgi:hypothetical protein